MEPLDIAAHGYVNILGQRILDGSANVFALTQEAKGLGEDDFADNVECGVGEELV